MTDQIPADAPEKPKKGARKGKRRPPGKGIANKRILAQERQRKALELRKSGATYAQIAAEFAEIEAEIAAAPDVDEAEAEASTVAAAGTEERGE